MPFTGDTFAKLYNWLTDPQRNEKIYNSRIDDELDGIATGLSTVKGLTTSLAAPQYAVAAASSDLANERVLTDTATVTWDFSVAGQAKANASGSSGAPDDAQYVTLATNGTLTSERVLTAGTGISLTDAGAGSTVTIADKEVQAQGGANADTAINSVTPVDVISDSVSITTGDVVDFEAFFTILNNSTANRTYTYTVDFGGFTASWTDAMDFHASDRATAKLHATLAVSATNLALLGVDFAINSGVIAAGTPDDQAVHFLGWNTTTSDLTGAQTVKFSITSSAATATQTFTKLSYTMRVRAAV
jgi:hypothetical protein